ncbi:MAG: hypothetical protein Q6363_001890 [Candidatus Njordarchaeota archaeon]
MIKIGVFDIIFFGKTKTEKFLNLIFIVSVLIALASVGLIFILDVPKKFVSVAFFNFAFAIWLLHLRNMYLEDGEEYKKIRKELIDSGVDNKKIDEYIRNKKEWDIAKQWLSFMFFMSIVIGFVYYLIP